jgi:tRNA threonylcarbamoyl adenosine modification protein YeaZ
MNILALELSTARGGIAWLKDAGTPMHQVEWPNDRKNSGPFFEQLEATIRKFGKPDQIIVGVGPGSYAGIRIAISAAIGVAAAGDVALLGYPSVCALPNMGDEYVVIGDARRHSFFFAQVKDRALDGSYELLNEAGLRARLHTLPAAIQVLSSDLLHQFDRVEQRFPSAELLGCLAFDERKVFSRTPLEPIYLREANITMPKITNRPGSDR